jgi:hypothetical protein
LVYADLLSIDDDRTREGLPKSSMTAISVPSLRPLEARKADRVRMLIMQVYVEVQNTTA